MIKIHFSFLKSERMFFLLFSRLNANECCYLSPPTRPFQVQVRRGGLREEPRWLIFGFSLILIMIQMTPVPSCHTTFPGRRHSKSEKKEKKIKQKIHNYLSVFVHGIYLGWTRVLKPNM